MGSDRQGAGLSDEHERPFIICDESHVPAYFGCTRLTGGRIHMLAPQSILMWIIIGAIAGWLAGRLVKGYGFGLIGNIVVGVLGAGIAGLLAPSLGLHTESTGGNIVASLLGALVLLFLVGLVRRT